METHSAHPGFAESISKVTPGKELDYFFSHAYYDMSFFLNSLTQYHSSSCIYFGDMQSQLFYISDNMRDAFGFESNLVFNLLEVWKDNIHGQKWKDIYAQDCKSMIEEKSSLHDLRYQVEDKNGRVFWIRCCGSLKWNEDKTKPLFFSGRISRQDEAFTVDRVTNFPNEDTLRWNLISRQKEGHSFWTVGFCLNNIFQINTMRGRSAADNMIREISDNLMDTLGDKMTFYRLPGIRCIALPDPGFSEKKETMIAEIREIIETAYRVHGIKVPHPCSFAVMHFPKNNVSAESFQENMVSLIKMARHSPQTVYIEDTEQNIRTVQKLSNMEMLLSGNVLNGMENFRAVIQPVVSAKNGKIIAGETLLRWKCDGMDISPATFVPILEKNGQIHQAGRWIMEQAVMACKKITRFIPDFYLSVNISLEQLYDRGLAEFIPAILQKYDLDGSHLVFEMTESCMDKEPKRLMELIKISSRLGIRFALDDFGTGYSSLRVLMKYPTDIIKLDRSLLLEMTESVDKSNFITSIVFACHQFGKRVCMEGVEDTQQIQLVRDAECDMIQGFYYYRPTELDDVYRIVKEQSETVPV